MNGQTSIDVLNNPVWYSLTTEHAHLAQGNNLAKRYPAEIAPLAALAAPDPSAFNELSSLD